MNNTKITARGFNATQPARVQIRNTIENMQKMRDGQDIRKYSASARKELLLGGTIDIMTKDGNAVTGVVPKLALVVVSSVFRDHLEKNPDITSVKVSYSTIDQSSVMILLKWINTIANTAGKFGINVPGFNSELIKVRHAAQMLGMDKYVTHFMKAYKDGLRDRVPSAEECLLLESCSIIAEDDMVKALGERMGYLRRIGSFTESELSIVADILQASPKIGKAVQEADDRAQAKRKGARNGAY